VISQALHHAGMDESAAAEKALLFAQAYKVLPGPARDRRAYFVPGRIEFLGKHADYCGGPTLLCNVERGLCFAATPRHDGILRVFNLSDGSDIPIPLTPDAAAKSGHWSNYFATVARRIARNFPGDLTGADLAVISDLPQAAGMSSSSACVVGTFMVLDHLNSLRERSEYRNNINSTEDLAGYLGTIENGQTFGTLVGDKGVGTFGGSEDHTSMLCSKPGHVSQFTYGPVAFAGATPLPEGYIIAIGVSGVLAEKTREAKDKYNAVSLRARAVLEKWRESTGRTDATLRDVVLSSPDATDRLRAILSGDESLLSRFNQFREEITQIVPRACSALTGNIHDLGPLALRSQELAEAALGNQVLETSFLARSAPNCGAVAGSSFGAGFGGSVWALVSLDRAETFLARWRKEYQEHFPETAGRSSFFLTRAGPAAIGQLL
jgi:galactokinase